MTPVPLDLPLRAAEAAMVAEVLFDSLHPSPILDISRPRFAARLASVKVESLVVYPGSLAADPIHPEAYYVAVDGVAGGSTRPLLLRIANASAPASGIFPNSLLIGRMRAGRSREVVVNAISFGPDDVELIRRFTTEVDQSFQPRPPVSRAPFTVTTSRPFAILPEAFAAFRYILRNRGFNYAVIGPADRTPESIVMAETAAAWSAIRAGWREGYALEIEPGPESLVPASNYSSFIAPVEREPEIEVVKQGTRGWKRFDPDDEIRERTRRLTERLHGVSSGFADVILDFAL